MAEPTLIDCWASVNPTTSENATWNGFEMVETGSRIDYVFTRGLVVRSAEIERPTTAEGRPIADHWPVRVVLEAVGPAVGHASGG
jgi:endonuclease/exonuclease/phosphatase family metal-dependent hydrolase